jgi:hypothetical protein
MIEAAKIGVAFAGATVAVRCGPWLLDLLGLNEFAFVGQIVLAILALSGLEALFDRFSKDPASGSRS